MFIPKAIFEGFLFGLLAMLSTVHALQYPSANSDHANIYSQRRAEPPQISRLIIGVPRSDSNNTTAPITVNEDDVEYDKQLKKMVNNYIKEDLVGRQAGAVVIGGVASTYLITPPSVAATAAVGAAMSTAVPTTASTSGQTSGINILSLLQQLQAQKKDENHHYDHSHHDHHDLHHHHHRPSHSYGAASPSYGASHHGYGPHHHGPSNTGQDLHVLGYVDNSGSSHYFDESYHDSIFSKDIIKYIQSLPGFNHHHGGNVYPGVSHSNSPGGEPKPHYGPPKPHYSPPKPHYGPPKPHYGPPKPTYGAPSYGQVDHDQFHSGHVGADHIHGYTDLGNIVQRPTSGHGVPNPHYELHGANPTHGLHGPGQGDKGVYGYYSYYAISPNVHSLVLPPLYVQNKDPNVHHHHDAHGHVGYHTHDIQPSVLVTQVHSGLYGPVYTTLTAYLSATGVATVGSTTYIFTETLPATELVTTLIAITEPSLSMPTQPTITTIIVSSGTPTTASMSTVTTSASSASASPSTAAVITLTQGTSGTPATIILTNPITNSGRNVIRQDPNDIPIVNPLEETPHLPHVGVSGYAQRSDSRLNYYPLHSSVVASDDYIAVTDVIDQSENLDQITWSPEEANSEILEDNATIWTNIQEDSNAEDNEIFSNA